MASAELQKRDKVDWPLANPWLWMALGTALASWSCGWAWWSAETASDLRIIVLALGYLVLAGGVWLRWNDADTLYLHPASPQLAGLTRLSMLLLFLLLFLTLSVLVGMTFFRPEQTRWKSGVTSLVWISVAPLSLIAAGSCFKRTPHQPILGVKEELAFSLIVAGLCCLIGTRTLQLPGDWSSDWDTIRVVLRVGMAVCLIGAALIVVSTRVRRLVLSLLILLHFAGIATACLSAPPSSWLNQQIWARIFRPYLEFMYLNNAYHFYAPDPGPHSYLWFRLLYEAPDQKMYGMWYKVPQVDEKGNVEHRTALEYQRFLALTEAVSGYESAPVPMHVDAKGKIEAEVQPPLYNNRLRLRPLPREERQVVIGIPDTPNFRIPLHPSLTRLELQVMIPNEHARRVLGSYIRFLANKFESHPEQAAWKLKSVKVYRVIHEIPSPAWLRNELPPNDPTLYRPYYMGHHRLDGSLLDASDPYLSWLLPIVRKNPYDPYSKILDFCRLHAGDPNWVRPQWSKEDPEPPAWGLPDAKDRELVEP